MLPPGVRVVGVVLCVGGDFVTVRAHSVAFLLLTAAFACGCMGASSGGVRLGSGPDDGGGHLG